MGRLSGFLAKMPFISHVLSRPARLSLDEVIAERLLAGQDAGPEASPAQRTLAVALRAAARPGTEQELSTEAANVAAFVTAVRTAGAARTAGAGATARPRSGRPPRRIPLMAAGMLATIVLAVCGTAVAGALPAPLQQLAHTFGAPAPDQPGHPAPVISGSSGETGLAPSPAASAGYPTASPPSTPQTHGKSASAPGQTKATATTATTPAASPTATATSTGNGNSGGNGKGNGGGNGKG